MHGGSNKVNNVVFKYLFESTSSNAIGPYWLFVKWDILQTIKTLSNIIFSVNWLWASIYDAWIISLQVKLTKFLEKAVHTGPIISVTKKSWFVRHYEYNKYYNPTNQSGHLTG